MRQMFTLSVFILITAVVGCGGGKPVPVLVTMDGKPVDGATVVLTSEDKGGATLNGLTGSDGTATLDSSPKGAVKAGTYKVVVTKVKALSSGAVDPAESKKMMMQGARPAKSELPEKYGSLKSTPLTLTIPPPSAPAKIELTSK